VISEEVGVTKPDPRIFGIALDRLGQRPESTVMVGDAWGTDIVGAHAAGLHAVWFNRFGAPSPDPSVAEIHALEPTHSIASFVVSPSPQSPIPNPQSPIPNPQSPIPNPESR
jgi:FMN phosphatase YigB (HAD superfamily)